MLNHTQRTYMHNIQTQALHTYQKNLAFFQQSVPSLYNKILALDTLLKEGTYPQKYDLEYKNGYFDVIELASGNFLYDQDSNIIAKKQCAQVSLKKDDQVFESYKNLIFDKETISFLKQQSSFSNFATMAPILDYYNRHIKKSSHMTQLNKFIFFGSGLGLHIDQIITKYNVQVPWIIEDNVELFRLSLFVTNYKKLSQNRDLFFAIGLNDTELSTVFNIFFSKAFMKNLYIKFYLFSEKNKDKIPFIQSKLVARPEVAYSHSRLLVKNIKVMYKLKEHFKFLNLLKKEREHFFQDKPILILGAGPSLHNNIEWLKKNNDKFIIMAALVTLKTLKKAGISPDIVVQVDENEFTTEQILNNLGDTAFLQDSIFIFSASVAPIMFETFKNNPIYLHEDRTKYKLAKSTMPVASVGESLYAISLVFNAGSIYMLGIDLALGVDGQSHSPDHFMAQKIDNTTKEEDLTVSLSNTVIQVKGNFRDQVDTTPLLSMSIPIINNKTSTYKSSNQTIYNLSDGAYFLNTIACKPQDVLLHSTIDKSTIKISIAELFDKYSSNQLDKEEMQALECRKQHIQESKKFLKEFKEKPYSNKDIFEANFIQFISALSNSKCRFELWEILITYSHRITPYIDDFLNTQELQQSKKHTKQLRNLVISQFSKIVDDYEKILEELMEDEQMCKS